MRNFLIITLAVQMISCNSETAEGQWIVGNEKQQIKTIEKQFRGFDMAMVETGYRYQELYWAGQDQNWEYAQYQIEKIEKAIKNGLERRPKRAESAQFFLDQILPKMEASITSHDSTEFNKQFTTLTNNCNACHAMEQVSYFKVKPPLHRQSPIR